MATSTVCITDKSGKQFWKTLCSTEYTSPEIRNMNRHLEAAAKNPKAYHFLDLETAIILVNGVPRADEPVVEMSDDELLTELLK